MQIDKNTQALEAFTFFYLPVEAEVALCLKGQVEKALAGLVISNWRQSTIRRNDGCISALIFMPEIQSEGLAFHTEERQQLQKLCFYNFGCLSNHFTIIVQTV